MAGPVLHLLGCKTGRAVMSRVPTAVGVCVAVAACAAATDTAMEETGDAVVCTDNGWIDVSVAAMRACGVHQGGCIECWGDVEPPGGDTGFSGYGLRQPPRVAATSVSVESFTYDTGEPSACVITTKADLVCWGQPLWVDVSRTDGVHQVAVATRSRLLTQYSDGSVVITGNAAWDYSVSLGKFDLGAVWYGLNGFCGRESGTVVCTDSTGIRWPFYSQDVEAAVGYSDACTVGEDG